MYLVILGGGGGRESSEQKASFAYWTFSSVCYVWSALGDDNPRDRVNRRPSFRVGHSFTRSHK